MRRVVLGVLLVLGLAAPAEAKKFFYADAAESLLEKSLIADQSVNPSLCGTKMRFYCFYTVLDIPKYLAAQGLKPLQTDERGDVGQFIYAVPFAGRSAKVSVVRLGGRNKLYLVQEVKTVQSLTSYISDLVNDLRMPK